MFQFFPLLGIESSETMEKEWESDYRLPQTTLPLHYDLYLFPNLKDDTFSGHVAISLDTKEPRTHFVVHVKNLKVSDTQLKVLVTVVYRVGHKDPDALFQSHRIS